MLLRRVAPRAAGRPQPGDRQALPARPGDPGQRHLPRGPGDPPGAGHDADRGDRAPSPTTMDRFGDRHADLPAILRGHFDLVAHRLPAGSDVSAGPGRADRRVLHPGVLGRGGRAVQPVDGRPSRPVAVSTPGELRFVMSVRAVGEGHVSSIEFRTGVLTGDGDVRVDEPGRHLTPGRPAPRSDVAGVPRRRAGRARRPGPGGRRAQPAAGRSSTPPTSTAPWPRSQRDRLTRGSAEAAIDRIRGIVARNYRVRLRARAAAERARARSRSAPDESHGIEDARFTRFVDDDGAVDLLRHLHRVRRGQHRAAPDPDRGLRRLRDQPADRSGRQEQGHGDLPAPGRRPLSRPCPGGIGRASGSRARPTAGSGATR